VKSETAEAEAQTETETEAGTETTIESDLVELRRHLLEQSTCPGQRCDRSISLISRSTPFFNREGEWTYQLCPFPGKPVFEGLISFLAKEGGGNPDEKGLISATGSSNYPYSNPRNVADLGTETYFCSNNVANQWMCYDFKDIRVGVTHYLIRTQGGGQGDWHLRSWVLEGSEDNSTLTELDRRDDDPRLNGRLSICSFDVRNVIESRLIRIRAIGPTWAGNHHLLFQALELFGALRVPRLLKLT
jgi:hypothetical protein